jgi:hypothetical protein
VPFLITFLSLGMLAGILPLLLSPTFRQIVRAIPQTWLVGVHAVRLAGFLFLALADMRLLPAEFALPAGYGDMAVGLLALWLVYLLVKQKPYARSLVIGWNVLGLLDFIVAITTGISEIGPYSAQLAASGVSLFYLSFVFIIPSFGIPLYALLHIYSLYQMLSRRVVETKQGVQESAPVFPGEQRTVQLQSK